MNYEYSNRKLIKDTTTNVVDVLENAHKAGLNYWRLLSILLDLSKEYFMKATAEYVAKGGS